MSGDRLQPDVELGSLRVPWSRSQRPVSRRVVQPLQAFLETEAGSGLVLLAAAAVALIWANSPWRASYEHLWSLRLTVRLGSWAIAESDRAWIDDGLMALVFLVVGLEIRRELLTGELRDPRAAALPVFSAIGGMVLPALIYLGFTAGTPASAGWGAAMPTDLVFALGVLALAGGVPTGVKAFVLALAIVDDVGTILVVALFYPTELHPAALGMGLALCAIIVALHRVHVRWWAVYVALGVGVWLAFREAGVSGTVAGVVLGLLTPAVPFQRPAAVSREAHRVADETVDDPHPPDADAAAWLYLARLSREAVSPLARMERFLHPWTSYLIVPLFALANAGVTFGGHLPSAATDRAAIGMVIARLVGKTFGITLAAALAVRLGLARLPAGTTWRHLVGAAAAAGVPFTVSLLVADLALSGSTLELAKVGILVAAVVTGTVGFALLRSSDRSPR